MRFGHPYQARLWSGKSGALLGRQRKDGAARYAGVETDPARVAAGTVVVVMTGQSAFFAGNQKRNRK
jgi:hypothetical protein